jgi:ribosomal protein L10
MSGLRQTHWVRRSSRACAVGGAVFALALAALAAGVAPAAGASKSYVSPSLLATANSDPNAKLRVIVQSSAGTTGAETAVISTGGLLDGDKIGRRLGIVRAVSAVMKAKRVAKLADYSGLTVTPDVQLKSADFSSDQLWPYGSGNTQLWDAVDGSNAAALPTIAIIDSGIDTTRADVAGRVVASVNLATATPNSPGDGRGHGTFVAGIAAGSAPAMRAPPPARTSSRSTSSTTTAWRGRATSSPARTGSSSTRTPTTSGSPTSRSARRCRAHFPSIRSTRPSSGCGSES